LAWSRKPTAANGAANETVEIEPVAEELHTSQFNTVLGRISFDEKGDVAGYTFVWYVWRNGTFMPLEQSLAKE
jgi:hypothetical protein